jgi:hypothetical protein
MPRPRIRERIANKEHTRQLKEEIKAINPWAKWMTRNVKALSEEGASIMQIQEDGYWWSPENNEDKNSASHGRK